MMLKSLGVTLLVASVHAIRRMEEAGEGATGDEGSKAQPDAAVVDVPFVETGAFIAIIAVAATLVLCMCCCITSSISNKNWVDAKRKEIEALSELATTPKGVIEYRKWGNAPYMLMMPGTPGFCQTVVGFDQFGFGVITVSRPGYARTPMTEELKKPEAQADLIMALFDHLGIEKFPILAASGAGVIALRMAIQYPDRVQALGMCCATTGKLEHSMYEMFEKNENRGGYESPTVARMGYSMGGKFAK